MKYGKPPAEAKQGTKLSRGANFRCLMSNGPIAPHYIKDEATAGRMRCRLMAIVAEGMRSRVYLPPQDSQERVALTADAKEAAAAIHVPIANDPRALWCLLYGLTHFDHLFTSRQLVALTTFSDLLTEVLTRAYHDALPHYPDAGNQQQPAINAAAQSCADAIGTYLAFAISKLADRGSSLCTWFTERDSTRHTFGRQAPPMAWDFAELNTLLDGTGSFEGAVAWTAESFENCTPAVAKPGVATQAPCQSLAEKPKSFFSTDPPYYDN